MMEQGSVKASRYISHTSIIKIKIKSWMKKTLHLQYNCHRNYSKCQLQIFAERGLFTVFVRARASPCVILLKFSPDENAFCFTKILYYRRKKDARGCGEKIPRQISHEIPGNLWKFTKTGEKVQICEEKPAEMQGKPPVSNSDEFSLFFFTKLSIALPFSQ